MPDELSEEVGRSVDLRAKVAFLSRPATYPDRPRRVEVRETHMSFVFLSTAHAYKLKKPVRYPYLDYGTIEARRWNCEREVDLNRRLARHVYLGVVPLTLGRDRRLHLGGHGETVDWLVKMRRLPSELTLEHAILSGTVRESDVRRVAARLVMFYRGLPRVDVDPDEYRRRFEEDARANRRELTRPTLDLPLDAIAEVAAAHLRFLSTRRTLLERRVEEKKIVDGHGDLRPEHVYLGAEPVITDCLEFDRALRIVDPVDELGFLAMECDRLGAPAAGAWLFDTYARATGDNPPAELVAFYKSARAFLRAKIAIRHVDDPSVREPPRWVRRAGDYVRLARAYLEAIG